MYTNRFRELTPYVPGEQPRDRKFIKLNTNETPYPPCPEIETLLRSADIGELRLYPDPEALELREAIAAAEGVSPSRVFVSNGSDEALSFCFYAFFDGTGGPLLFPEHTYSFYPVYCRFYGTPFRRVGMRSDFGIDLSAVLQALPEACGVIFPNPNAPTGRYEPLPEIEPILRNAAEGQVKKAVVIDEAYIDFGGESAVSLIDTYPNLAVVKTYSKGYSLAGIRLGYIIASEQITKALTTVKDSFNSYPLDRLTQKIGTAAIRSGEYYRQIQEKIIATRERAAGVLRDSGWEVLPSMANFLFMKHPAKSGSALYGFFRDAGILVRHFKTPGIENYIRVTVGTDDEMDRFLQVCETITNG